MWRGKSPKNKWHRPTCLASSMSYLARRTACKDDMLKFALRKSVFMRVLPLYARVWSPGFGCRKPSAWFSEKQSYLKVLALDGWTYAEEQHVAGVFLSSGAHWRCGQGSPHGVKWNLPHYPTLQSLPRRHSNNHCPKKKSSVTFCPNQTKYSTSNNTTRHIKQSFDQRFYKHQKEPITFYCLLGFFSLFCHSHHIMNLFIFSWLIAILFCALLG